MIRIAGAPFALSVFVVASAFAKSTAPEVIFISPCECQGFHGKNRWIAKTDLTPVPMDKSAIQSVTLSSKADTLETIPTYIAIGDTRPVEKDRSRRCKTNRRTGSLI